MSTVSRTARYVHSEILDRDPTPPELLDDETSYPSEPDEFWLVAFNAAYAGEPARCPEDSQIHGEDAPAWHSHFRGTAEGTRARQIDAAYALGKKLGVISDIACPPASYLPHEDRAFRDGFAARRREWVAALEFERIEWEAERYADHITDADVYRPGATS